MYTINLIIIYDVVNIFSVKNDKSLRKLRVDVNRYMGMTSSTTTIEILTSNFCYGSVTFLSCRSGEPVKFSS